jgi:hypothetical protein
MAVLATYKAHVTPKYDTFLPFRVAVAYIAAVVFIGGAVLTTYLNWQVEVLLLYLPALCFVAAAVVYIDTYMKWHCTEETVSVQHEMLVVERRKCLFGRRKEIPLSAIKKVETYDDGTGQRSETLRVVYSNTSYRFGLCLSDADRQALGRKIMELAGRYV